MIQLGSHAFGRDHEGKHVEYKDACKEFEERRQRQLASVPEAIERNRNLSCDFCEERLRTSWSEMDKNRPQEMLSAAAWSLLHNALHIYIPVSRWGWFSKETKLRVLADSGREALAALEPYPAATSTSSHLDDMVRLVQALEYGDELIEKQPVMHLGYGILTSTNASFWAMEDLTKFGRACGASSKDGRDKLVRAILKEQIELLEEIVDRNWHVEAEAREYNPLVGILADSKRFLASLVANDHPAESMKQAVEQAKKKRKEAPAQESEENKKPKVAAAASE